MSYPWWHIKATFRDGTECDYEATELTPRYAMETLLSDGRGKFLAGAESEHGDLVKLEVLHPSTPGLDPKTEDCPVCASPPLTS